MEPHKAAVSVASGALAGFIVDVSLYPLDTVRTRLQSRTGFWTSGGLTGVYRGLSVVLYGSVFGGAAFFGAYDTTKECLIVNSVDVHSSRTIAAVVGECVACLVRAPVEMTKQQMQVKMHGSLLSALRCICASSPRGALGLYAGYGVTVCRDIPFGMVQFPLWEFLKSISPVQSVVAYGVCGSVAAALAAWITTPLDVTKTRVMLRQARQQHFFLELLSIGKHEGVRALFAGASARVTWISLGGAIFLGSYDYAKAVLSQVARY